MSDETTPPNSQQRAEGNNIAQALGPGATANVTHNTIYQYAPTQEVNETTLGLARATLSKLPTDPIPTSSSDSSDLPRCSKMPFRANPNFVGREEELKGLAKALKQGTDSAITATTGIGGIGKSQLAIEFVYRYGLYFAGGVYWLNFAEPDGIPTEIATCGGADALNLHPDFANLPLAEQVKHVSGFFKNPLPKLLVFDNCEDHALVDKWHPKQGGSRVLITSRKDDWPVTLGIKQFRLQTLGRDKSIALLGKYRPDLEEQRDELGAVADELGDLPLALHLAGNFLRRYRDSPLGQPANYLQQLRSQNLLNHPSLQDRRSDHAPTGTELHVAKTFALSYNRLNSSDPIDKEAMQLFARAACFAPGEAIPSELLTSVLHLETIDEANQEKSLQESLQTEDALARLANLGLLEREAQGGVKLHRLIAAFAQSVNLGSEAQDAVEEYLSALANVLNEKGFPGPLLTLQPHLRFVTDKALKRQDEGAADLGRSLSFHLYQIADFDAGIVYAKRARDIYEEILGPEHQKTAASIDSLGILLQAKGDYEAARLLYEHALDIAKKVLSPEHKHVAASLSNLGALSTLQGKHDEAKTYHKRALVIREKVLRLTYLDILTSLPATPESIERGEDLKLGYLNTAISLNNLGDLLVARGEYEEAEPLLRRALAIRIKWLEPEHPDVATTLRNFGNLFQAQGKFEMAGDYFERALLIRKRFLRPEHPKTRQALNSLINLLRIQGKY